MVSYIHILSISYIYYLISSLTSLVLLLLLYIFTPSISVFLFYVFFPLTSLPCFSDFLPSSLTLIPLHDSFFLNIYCFSHWTTSTSVSLLSSSLNRFYL